MACRMIRGENIGKKHPSYIDGRTSKPNFCKVCNKRIDRMAKNCSIHKTMSLSSRQKTSDAQKKLWNDSTHRRKMIVNIFKSNRCLPNKPEKFLIKSLNDILPDAYKYVGNGKFWIERFNPDFINSNGQKKIIEFFGEYWHSTPKAIQRDKIRLKTYKKYGYDTLVIKQKDFVEMNSLEAKILAFNATKE